MKCNLSNRSELIASYLAGEISETEKLSFEKHYFECSECFAELKCVDDAVRVIRQEGLEAFSESTSSPLKSFTTVKDFLTDLIEIIQRRPAFVSAIVLFILIVVSSFIYFQLNQSQSGNEFYATNFEPSPALESYMQQTLKSNQIVVEANPANDETFKKPEIEFRWTLREGYAEIVKPLELKILNNKQKPLYYFQINKNSFAFNEKLEPGLYYWTLLSENEMIYLGKFFIRD